ncbi:MAG: hypothetical protein ABI614_04700 [Planctomycetota bacterium]
MSFFEKFQAYQGVSARNRLEQKQRKRLRRRRAWAARPKLFIELLEDREMLDADGFSLPPLTDSEFLAQAESQIIVDIAVSSDRLDAVWADNVASDFTSEAVSGTSEHAGEESPTHRTSMVPYDEGSSRTLGNATNYQLILPEGEGTSTDAEVACDAALKAADKAFAKATSGAQKAFDAAELSDWNAFVTAANSAANTATTKSNTAQTTHDGNRATAKATYNTSIAAADTGYATATSTAQTKFDTAKAAAKTTFNGKEATANTTYDSAVNAATKTYDGAVTKADAAYDKETAAADTAYAKSSAGADATFEASVKGGWNGMERGQVQFNECW